MKRFGEGQLINDLQSAKFHFLLSFDGKKKKMYFPHAYDFRENNILSEIA